MAERIMVVSPSYDGTEAEVHAAKTKFWESIDADPAMVVCAEVFTDGERGVMAVWSAFSKALLWAKDEPGDGAVIYSKRIDEPMWGGALH